MKYFFNYCCAALMQKHHTFYCLCLNAMLCYDIFLEKYPIKSNRNEKEKNEVHYYLRIMMFVGGFLEQLSAHNQLIF